jgi:hypothetical protein
MRRHDFSLFAVPLLWLVACQGADVPASDPGLTNPPAVASLTLTRLRTDSSAFALYSGVNVPENLVIRDAAAWSALWQNIHATTEPVPPLPDIDFSLEMIVASALGARNSGYNVLLTRATEGSGGVQIEVLETSPGATCATTQALTQPIDLGRVARRDGPVRFLATQHVERCGP